MKQISLLDATTLIVKMVKVMNYLGLTIKRPWVRILLTLILISREIAAKIDLFQEKTLQLSSAVQLVLL